MFHFKVILDLLINNGECIAVKVKKRCELSEEGSSVHIKRQKGDY